MKSAWLCWLPGGAETPSEFRNPDPRVRQRFANSRKIIVGDLGRCIAEGVRIAGERVNVDDSGKLLQPSKPAGFLPRIPLEAHRDRERRVVFFHASIRLAYQAQQFSVLFLIPLEQVDLGRQTQIVGS
jgi:hypothetical protein